MGMDNPYPTFATLASLLRELYPRLAYLHIVEPYLVEEGGKKYPSGGSSDVLRTIWQGYDKGEDGSTYISAGGYTPETAIETAEKKGGLIAFGRYFTSNVSTSSTRISIQA